MADHSTELTPASINPAPTDEEAAAIVAALTLGWPRPAVDESPTGPLPTRWRFSGRWWNKRSWKG